MIIFQCYSWVFWSFFFEFEGIEIRIRFFLFYFILLYFQSSYPIRSIKLDSFNHKICLIYPKSSSSNYGTPFFLISSKITISKLPQINFSLVKFNEIQKINAIKTKFGITHNDMIIVISDSHIGNTSSRLLRDRIVGDKEILSLF